MSRNFKPLTVNVLNSVSQKNQIGIKELYQNYQSLPYKEFYNLIYRLFQQGLVEKSEVAGDLMLSITKNGRQLLNRLYPQKDGVWKLVIFDIPEKHKYARNVLRARLKLLNFKKWQNSIWVSPYELNEEIEQELQELAKKFFIRLIKTTAINRTDDLEQMFK